LHTHKHHIILRLNHLDLHTHKQHLILRLQDIGYRLTCGSIIFATFLAVGMGLAYMRDGLYASIYGI